MVEFKGDFLKGIPEEVFSQDGRSIKIQIVNGRELYGRQGDIKPTNVEIGTTFFDIDNKLLWIFNGDEWILM
jgi:hypothetical protein